MTVKITLTLEEAQNLYLLVRESSSTGNEDLDETMQEIEEKLRENI